MAMFYSVSRNTCYGGDSRNDYDLAGSWPEDAVEITNETFERVVLHRPPDKVISPGADGLPELADMPAPSVTDLAAYERSWRNSQLLSTDPLVARHRDELEEGSETTLTPTQYAELQAYRRALRNWPEAGEFPLIDHRPPSPLWLTAQPQ